QRDEGLAVETHRSHHAIGDERRARKVTGIFEDPDEKKQQKNLGQEDQHRADALPYSVDQQRLDPTGGQQRSSQIAQVSKNGAKTVGKRLTDGEYDFEDPDDHRHKEQRSPDAMQKNVVELAAVFSRQRRFVTG